MNVISFLSPGQDILFSTHLVTIVQASSLILLRKRNDILRDFFAPSDVILISADSRRDVCRLKIPCVEIHMSDSVRSLVSICLSADSVAMFNFSF